MADTPTDNDQIIKFEKRQEQTPISGNPLIRTSQRDTLSASRAYLANMANMAALDDQIAEGHQLSMLVLLNALDHALAQAICQQA